MTITSHIYVALLHDKMVDKTGRLVTTSVTLIDTHDISRSCRTYGAQSLFVVHPAQTVRALVRTVKEHWDTGFGSTYNPNRQDALGRLCIVSDLDEAILQIEQRSGKLPKLIATSARDGEDRISYEGMREIIASDDQPFLVMFGTGWGMSDELMGRADFVLKPINGPTEYNHLSVRAACAIILDRLFGV
ncbi:MAG: hypothetical protein RIS36_895 [Pseudomonadota bacterium]|jgi:hypothetical protein